jgi:hypothetical protein
VTQESFNAPYGRKAVRLTPDTTSPALPRYYRAAVPIFTTPVNKVGNAVVKLVGKQVGKQGFDTEV